MCKDNISNHCSEPILSTCVDHEADLGENTTIEKECVNQSMVNTDLYKITDNHIKNTQVDNSEDSCITYPEVEGKVINKIAIETNRDEICNIKNDIEQLQNFEDYSIEPLNLDFKCLQEQCGEPIIKLKTLLQILIDKVCQE